MRIFDDFSFDDIEEVNINLNTETEKNYVFQFQSSAKLIDINEKMYIRSLNLPFDEYYIHNIIVYYDMLINLFENSYIINDYTPYVTVLIPTHSIHVLEHAVISPENLYNKLVSECTSNHWIADMNIHSIQVNISFEVDFEDDINFNEIYKILVKMRNIMLSWENKRTFNYNTVSVFEKKDENNPIVISKNFLKFKQDSSITSDIIETLLRVIGKEYDYKSIVKQLEKKPMYRMRHFGKRDILYNVSRLSERNRLNPYEINFQGFLVHNDTTVNLNNRSSYCYLFDLEPKEDKLFLYNSSSVVNYFKESVNTLHTLRDLKDYHHPKGYEVCYLVKIDKDEFVDMETDIYKDYYAEYNEKLYGMHMYVRIFFLDRETGQFLCSERPNIKKDINIENIQKQYERLKSKIYV